MAKRANRNLSQLRKDNRQSTIPTICSRKKCENEALLIKGPTGKRVKICKPHYLASKAKPVDALLASMGLV